MIYLAMLLLVFGLTAPAVAADARVPESREAVHLSFAPVVKKAAPAVVNVFSRRVEQTQSPFAQDPFFRRFFGEDSPFGAHREQVQNALGSGVILDPGGLVVTNHHVVEKAQEIRVVLNDRREFDAKVLLSDEHSDLAVLKIDPHGETLPTLPLGDSDGLEVGDLVLAIGNPFGVGQTVTSGIVSALARAVGVGDYRSFIQTDAAINPGNSGGALVDLDGRLVGINTAIYSRSGGSVGLGFAIPTAMVKIVLEAARHGGKVVRPWFGVSVQPVTSDLVDELHLPHPSGVLIKEVVADSPAAKAGLKPGDVILDIAGREVDDVDALRFRVATLAIDAPAPIEFWRAGAGQTATIALTAPPDTPARALQQLAGRHPLAGATVGNLNPAYDDELGLEPTQRGVVVAQIAGASPAARIGLQPGDILVTLNRRAIESVPQLEAMLTDATPPWSIAVKRAGKVLTVTVQ